MTLQKEEEREEEEKAERRKKDDHSADRLLGTDKRAIEEAFIEDCENFPEALIELYKSADLPEADLKACYNIVYETSYRDYARTSEGWRKNVKLDELQDPNMVFAILRAVDPEEHFSPTVNTDILAFVSFKLDYDDPPNDERTVVYVFELHVGKAYRGKGIGRFLLWIAENMAREVGVYKTMLTVFRSNASAIRLYRKLFYVVDGSSPAEGLKLRNRVARRYKYMIMSKNLRKDH
ncbi:unnamed protein product [Periconia digitata]|uniref:N-alpha-acetyltransferase 40 n=1 Tax=Periconia digitata TaxID=1303443 RepID=A0A9W4UUS8_9PLEO|nr:unnamed protein product [Periconia digitata]